MATPQTYRSNAPSLAKDDPPPFLRTWKRVYTAVLGYLFSLILALYLLTQHFRY